MNMKTLLAGMLLSGVPVMAFADDMPEICKSVTNYAVQTLQLTFSDGSWADKHNPKSVDLKRNFKKYPMTIQTLGNCEDDTAKLKESWCQVAGGSPEVFQAEVSEKDSGGSSYPIATVVVTYNRGGCWVDEVSRK